MTKAMTVRSSEPQRDAPVQDCPLCPRLADYRHRLQEQHPTWYNAPVASFGATDAPLLIVGLAPGMAGANRTGRPFTGDFAGEVLYPALANAGLSRGRFAADPLDGLELVGCRIANAVRCVPPQNKPTGVEIVTCRRFLVDELTMAPAPKVVLTLGRIAYESVLRVFRLSPARHPFGHGAEYALPGGPIVVATYHTSRYNINTRKLTPEMFESVLARAVGYLRQPNVALLRCG